MADLLAGLSIASDIGFGLPPETAMRTCLIATGIARKLGADEEQVADTFYAGLLVHVGCHAFAHETAAVFGDELAVTRAAARTNLADPSDLEATLLPEATRGLEPASRKRLEELLLRHVPTFGHRFDIASCEVASALAARIGLGAGAAQALAEIGEWWDGSGVPRGLREEDISFAARVARAAADAAVLVDVGGADAAAHGVRRRAGSLLDPTIAETFAVNAVELAGEAQTGDPRRRLLAREPHPVAERGEDELILIAEAFGNVADLKTPALHGHSAAVAALARASAARMGLDTATSVRLELAALLHDLGRLGVTNAVWEKPGPLTSAEWEQVRMHSYYSERILATSASLQPLAAIAGMHHERLDGSGYHRGSHGRDQSVSVRILAAADAYQAMTQHRPHRAALSPEQAADQLHADARAGLLDAECVAAVLDAAGHEPPRRKKAARPGGLSDREVQVLRLVAAGYSNPQIAKELVISRRTAEHHVQHIYAKLGVSSRPAVALFALENDLL